MTDATVVMVTLGKPLILGGCVSRLRRLGFGGRIIVAENADAEDETSRAFCEANDAEYFAAAGCFRRNAAQARNLAIRMVTTDVVVLMCPDVWLATLGGIEELACNVTPEVACMATVYDQLSNGALSLHMLQGSMRPAPLFFLGALHRESICKIGGYWPHWSAMYHDDTWFAACLAHHGVQFAYHAGVVAFHQSHERPNESAMLGETKAQFDALMAEGRFVGGEPWPYVQGRSVDDV